MSQRLRSLSCNCWMLRSESFGTNECARALFSTHASAASFDGNFAQGLLGLKNRFSIFRLSPSGKTRKTPCVSTFFGFLAAGIFAGSGAGSRRFALAFSLCERYALIQASQKWVMW